MRARLRLPQLVLRPPGDDHLAVGEIVREDLLEGQHPRDAVDQGEHDRSERGLHLGMLEQLVLHDLGIDVAPQLDHDAHALSVALVAEVGDAGELLLPHQLGDPLDHGGLVHHVGELGDDNRHSASPQLLDRGFGADDHAAPPLQVGGADPVPAEDPAAGGKVRSFDDLEQRLRLEVRIVDEGDEGVHQLAEIVGRDVGGHPDRDARGAVHQEVGHPAGQHDRLLHRLVEVGDEGHGLFVDVGEQLHRHPGEARLRVAHRPRRIAVHAAEVALPVDQRVAEAEVLRHPHEGFVDRHVPVRVVPAHHVPDDARALPVRPVGRQAHLGRAVEDAALHRLEPVTDVRERPADDDGHRVVQIRCPHLLFDWLLDDVLFGRRHITPRVAGQVVRAGSPRP